MNHFRSMTGGYRWMTGGYRKFWAVQADKHGYRSGDAIKVTLSDGSIKEFVVRRIISTRAPEGDILTVCPYGTPPVCRPLEDKER
jgi:hypothetical protein